MSTDNLIDAAVEEITSSQELEVDESTPEPENEEKAPAEEVEKETTEDDDTEKEGEKETEEGKDDVPDKVRKSMRKKERYTRNLRERNKNLQDRINELETQKIETKVVDEENFEGNYGDFIKQQAVEEMRAELGLTQQKQEINSLQQQQDAIMVERSQKVSEEAGDYASNSSDFKDIMSNEEAIATLDSLAPEIQELFFELENAPLAAYALVKEGKLDNLAYMSPYMAAAELLAAQARGSDYYKESLKTPITKAPAPMRGVKGISKGSKNLDDKTPEELIKHFGL